jgi:hypothetical protein
MFQKGFQVHQRECIGGEAQAGVAKDFQLRGRESLEIVKSQCEGNISPPRRKREETLGVG